MCFLDSVICSYRALQCRLATLGVNYSGAKPESPCSEVELYNPFGTHSSAPERRREGPYAVRVRHAGIPAPLQRVPRRLPGQYSNSLNCPPTALRF